MGGDKLLLKRYLRRERIGASRLNLKIAHIYELNFEMFNLSFTSPPDCWRTAWGSLFTNSTHGETHKIQNCFIRTFSHASDSITFTITGGNLRKL